MVRRLGLGKNNHLTYASLAFNPRYYLLNRVSGNLALAGSCGTLSNECDMYKCLYNHAQPCTLSAAVCHQDTLCPLYIQSRACRVSARCTNGIKKNCFDPSGVQTHDILLASRQHLPLGHQTDYRVNSKTDGLR